MMQYHYSRPDPFAEAGLADLTRRGGKTVCRIQEMTTNGHPNPVAGPVAAAKLFTAYCAGIPQGPLPAHE